MTRRERIMNSLNFKPVDKIPKDLGGMASTGISCFAYKNLIEYLGFDKRKIKVWDTGQMLALPDLDVLDYLDCDVVMTNGVVTNAFPQDELWKDYDFNGRLEGGAVLTPSDFYIREDSTIVQHGTHYMSPSAKVFNEDHAGQPFNLDDDFIKVDLVQLQKELNEYEFSDEEAQSIAENCKKVRESTQRAVMFNGLNGGIGFRTGMVQYSMMCMLEPEYIEEYHRILIGFTIKKYKKVIPLIAPYVDIIMSVADDMGTQNSLILPAETAQKLYFQFYKQLNDVVHEYAPEMKTFLHSCGAIYDLIDVIIDSGFDILNPVQWSAGTQSYQQWKDKARNRISFWGGGVDSQHTLPTKTTQEIEQEVKEVSAYFAKDSGFVFNNIHNILAEIEPEKVVAMYQAVK